MTPVGPGAVLRESGRLSEVQLFGDRLNAVAPGARSPASRRRARCSRRRASGSIP